MASNERFYSRMREMAGIKPVNESTKEANANTLIDFQKSNDGVAYGIVKENHHYYIKKAFVNEGEPKVTDFTFIDGVANKSKYQYNSLGEAEKQRNFYLSNINEAWSQGGVYFKNESTESDAPSMDTKEDFKSLINRTITEGKKNIARKKEEKFKSSLSEQTERNKKRGLMPEAADLAVKKALGLPINEVASDPFTEKSTASGSDEVTADSDQKNGERVSEKSGKESPQAPINDSNAKAHADKATGSSKKDANKKPNASDSIAVNQQDDVLKEEVLVTADSELNSNDSLANHTGSKEGAQAPINDTNAKAHADKAMATGGAAEDSSMANQIEQQPESDPFDDKEDKGDEKGDIVTEDADKGDPFDDAAKVQTSGDEVSADSDAKDADRVDNESGHEAPQAEYNNYNQPEKGHKEHKGEQSEQPESDPFDDKTKAGQEKGDIVAEAANALSNLIGEGESVENKKKEQPESDPFDDKEGAGDEKGDIVAEGDADEQPESDPFKDKENAGDEKGDIVAEGDVEDAMADKSAEAAAKADMKDDGENVHEGDIVTADSEINPEDSPANEDKGNVSYDKGDIKKGTSMKMNDNAIAEAGEEDMEAAANALNDLEVATDAEETTPEVPAEEPAMDGGEAPAPDMGGEEVPAEEPAMDGGEAPAEEPSADTGDLAVKEIEKLVGKATQKIRSTELEPETAEGFLKSIVSSFEDKLPEMDIEDRKEVSDKILKAEGGDLSDPEASAEEVPAEEPVTSDENGLDADAEAAIDDKIDNIGGEEPTPEMAEDAPMKVNGEDHVEEGDCSECGTFETYMESRGYSKDSISEYSIMEMANVVSGYANAFNEGLNDGDFAGVASVVNEDVLSEVSEYGHGSFVESVTPHLTEGGVDFGTVEPTLSPIEEGKAEDMDGDGDIDSDDYMAKKDAAIKKSMKNEEAGVESHKEEQPESDPFDDKEKAGDVKSDIVSEDNGEGEEPSAFAPAGDVMAVGAPKPQGGGTKTVDVDLESGKVTVQVSESMNEEKIRNYVQERLQILAGKKGESINESKKSENLKKFDKLIERQYKLFSGQISKKKSLAEAYNPRSIQKVVERVNQYINQAIADDVDAVETDSTWESVYRFQPVQVNGDYVTITYDDVYDRKPQKSERYKWNHQDEYHVDELKHMFQWILKTIKKGYRSEGKTPPKF